MKIRIKIIITIFTLVSLSFLFSILYGYFEIRHVAIINAESSLQIIANIQKSRIEYILKTNNERINAFTNRTGVISALESFDQNPNEKDRQDLLTRLLDAKKSSGDYQDLSIVNSQGDVISSTDHTKINSNIVNSASFQTGIDNNYINFISENGQNSFTLSGPIKKEDGTLLGVVIIDTNTNDLNNIVKDYTGLSNSGETLLGKYDESGNIIYLQETRFPNNISIVNKNNTSLPIAQALLKNEKIFTNLSDYRGQKVYAVTKYLPSTNWGMVVKIDQAEVLEPVKRSSYILLIIMIVFFGIAYIIALIFSKTISDPIEVLNKGAQEIRKGNLEYKIEIKSHDEIGELAKTYNEMTIALMESNKNIEKKVQERTKELEKTNKTMVGRELKMIELKKNIEKLQNEIIQKS